MEVNIQALRTAKCSLECMERYVRAICEQIDSANRAVSKNTMPQEIRRELLNIESDLYDLEMKLDVLGVMVGEAGDQYAQNERILEKDRTIARCIGRNDKKMVIAGYIRFVPICLIDHRLNENMQKFKASLKDALFHE